MTPIPMILLAIEGKIDWLRRTTPGLSEQKAEPPAEKVEKRLAEALRSFKRR